MSTSGLHHLALVVLTLVPLAGTPALAAPSPEPEATATAPASAEVVDREASVQELDLAGVVDAPTPSTVQGLAEPDGGPAQRRQSTPVEEEPLPTAVLTTELDTHEFTVLGLTWDNSPQDVEVKYRTRQAGEWGEWQVAEASQDAPDLGSVDAQAVEAAQGGSRVGSEPIVAPHADGIQVWAATTTGDLGELKAVLVDPGTDPVGVDATASTLASAPPTPNIVSRAQWGADEGSVGCDAEYASSMVAATVHHTAGSNNYSAADVPGILRGIMEYHVRPEADGGRGWCDIGYNFLVDRFGRTFEGRHGGIDQPVIGVHTGGFNSRTMGVSAIGDYGAVTPPAALVEALSQLIAWRFALYKIDADATVVLVSGGGATFYPEGTPVRFSTVFAHRDVQSTSCPGQQLYDVLPTIRARVSALARDSVLHSPFGVLDPVGKSGSSIVVSGWALDPDGAAKVPVHIFVDGVGVPVVADRTRADVGAAYPGWGPDHGFSTTLSVPGGRHVVCAYALDDGSASNTVLGCRVVTTAGAEPAGRVDEITNLGGGKLRVSGWAFDPDSTAPIAVHVYVGGRGFVLAADGPSPAVAAMFPGTGPAHAFTGTFDVGAGVHNVCVYAINVGPGVTKVVECRTVTVTANDPVGRIDELRVSGSFIVVSGWAFDADTTAPIAVHAYVDSTGHVLNANGPSPALEARFPGVGGSHAFSARLPATPGTHRVCLYGINVGSGGTSVIGCADVVVPVNNPVGRVDDIQMTRSGLHVAGWAFDADTTSPIAVHVYVDGTGFALLANGPSPAVAGAFPGVGDAHAFDASLPVAAGQHRVCFYGINVGPGANSVIECRTIG